MVRTKVQAQSRALPGVFASPSPESRGRKWREKLLTSKGINGIRSNKKTSPFPFVDDDLTPFSDSEYPNSSSSYLPTLRSGSPLAEPPSSQTFTSPSSKLLESPMPKTPTMRADTENPLFTTPKRQIKSQNSSSASSWNSLGTIPRSMGSSNDSTPEHVPISIFGRPSTEPDSYFDGNLKGTSRRRKSELKGNDSSSDSSLKEISEKLMNPNRGPRVKPFIFVRTRNSNSGAARSTTVASTTKIAQKCQICGELLKSTLQNEKLITLLCGDTIHGECYDVTIDFEFENALDQNDIATTSSIQKCIDVIVPNCKGPVCSKATTASKLVPVNIEILERKILDKQKSYQKSSVPARNSNILALSSTLEKPIILPEKQSQHRTARVAIDSLLSSSELQSCIARYSSIKSGHGSGNISLPSLNLGSNQSIYRTAGNPRYSFSRSPSPTISINTIQTSSLWVKTHGNMSLDSVRNHFIKYLLEHCSSFSLTDLLKLGTLRLADYLLVSYDGPTKESFTSKTVYLFENYIIIWNISEELFLFRLEDLEVCISLPSMLRISRNSKNAAIQNIWLSSDIGTIIEKWVIATSDFRFNFPVELLTSTMILPSLTSSDTIESERSTENEAKSLDVAVVLKNISQQVKNDVVLNKKQITVDLISEEQEEDDEAEEEVWNIPNSVKGKSLKLEKYDSSDSDSDSDYEVIRNISQGMEQQQLHISSDKIDELFKKREAEPEGSHSHTTEVISESDEDSDTEIIQSLLK